MSLSLELHFPNWQMAPLLISKYLAPEANSQGLCALTHLSPSCKWLTGRYACEHRRDGEPGAQRADCLAPHHRTRAWRLRFQAGPKVCHLPLWQEEGSNTLEFWSRVGNLRPGILIPLWFQVDIFKDRFLSKFKKKRREIRARIGDNQDQWGFCLHLTIGPSLRCLCYLICKSGWEL